MFTHITQSPLVPDCEGRFPLYTMVDGISWIDAISQQYRDLFLVLVAEDLLYDDHQNNISRDMVLTRDVDPTGCFMYIREREEISLGGTFMPQ